MSTSIIPSIPRSNKPQPVKARVVSLHIAGKSNSQIGNELGISKTTVGRILEESELGQRSSNSQSIENVLANAGLTTETISQRYAELVTAEEHKLAIWEGKFSDEKRVPDHTTRLNAARDVAKMLGMFPEDMGATAQLFVKLPDTILTKGHSNTCMCDECCRNWESSNHQE